MTPASQNRLVVFCCVAGFCFSAALAVQSDAGEGDYDDLEHYLRAAWSFRDARYLLDEWGRPGFTALYAFPARFGWLAARLYSGALSSLAAYVAFAAARKLDLPSAWLAAPLTLAQPLFFVLSYTTLTETAVAFYLATSLYLMLSDRSAASSAVFSVVLVTRYETTALLPLWVLAIVLRGHARKWALPLLLWAPLLHNLLAAAVSWPLPARVYVGALAKSYGAGDAFSFVAHLSTSAGLVIAVLALTGCRGLLRFRTGWLISGSVFVFVAVQTVLYTRGAYGTGGYARFLVSIAPLLGIAAAQGWSMLGPSGPQGRAENVGAVLAAFALVYGGFEMHRMLADIWWGKAAAWAYRAVALAVGVGGIVSLLKTRRLVPPSGFPAAVRVCAVLLIAGQLIVSAEPLRTGVRHREILDALAFAEPHGLRDRVIHYAGPWVVYATHTFLPPDRLWFAESVARAEPGDLVIWDELYGKDETIGVPLRRLWPSPNWTLRYAACPRPGPWPSVMLFEQTASLSEPPGARSGEPRSEGRAAVQPIDLHDVMLTLQP